MTISHAIQVIIMVLAALAFIHGWCQPEPYGGDAGLLDAFEKLFSYAVTILLTFIVIIWLIVQRLF